MTWSIAVYEKNHNLERAEGLTVELQRQIIQASKQHRPLIDKLSKTPSGHFIQIPFALNYNGAQELVEHAEQQLLRDARDRSLPPAERDDALSPLTLFQAAFFQLFAAAEALLNLVYELYLKSDLRDDRISQHLSREQIDLKLRLAPIYCECFVGKPFDHTTDLFRKFQKWITVRNNFIHANITKDLKQPVVKYDDLIFILDTQGWSGPSLEDVKDLKQTVDALVSQILSNMQPRYRKEFGLVVHHELISVEYEDGMPVIVTAVDTA